MEGEMSESVQINIDGQALDFPVVLGSEFEKAIDVTKLRAKTGYITLDDGYMNTGACKSAITFIDGENGILRYRGYPIEQLAEHVSFVEVAYLLIWGEFPTEAQKTEFSSLLTEHAEIHPALLNHFNGFPRTAHPMSILSAMLNAVSAYHPHLMQLSNEALFKEAATKIISKVRTIAAYSYRKSKEWALIPPDPKKKYCANFLHMMFSTQEKEYEIHPDIEKALNLFFVLHGDHEQNCSTSTVRMVGSSKANIFSSVSAGVSALSGPLHGGANAEVIQMLEEIHNTGKGVGYFVDMAKQKDSKFKLMGFGHRVYKNFDPRSKILKFYVDKVLLLLNRKDPLLDIARKLEEAALADPYFKERKLYPNVDFYSGILLRAIGVPVDLFTVMFAIGRMPGWIAHWKEVHDDPTSKINRPRQIYMGSKKRDYILTH
jgi:citrate synthase